MSELATVTTALQTRYADNIATATAYPNAPITEPSDTEWCRLSILPGETVQQDTGGTTNTRRMPGVMQVDVFSPIGGGTAAAAAVAKSVADLFRNWDNGSGVVCGEPSVADVGARPASKWWQLKVSVPWRYDWQV